MIESRRNRQRTSVFEKGPRAVNRIGESFLFAQNLEQPRTHALAHDSVEHAQAEAALVVARAGANTERQLRLLDLFRVKMNDGRGLPAIRGNEAWLRSRGRRANQTGRPNV